jgi:hypothetical protein
VLIYSSSSREAWVILRKLAAAWNASTYLSCNTCRVSNLVSRERPADVSLQAHPFTSRAGKRNRLCQALSSYHASPAGSSLQLKVVPLPRAPSLHLPTFEAMLKAVRGVQIRGITWIRYHTSASNYSHHEVGQSHFSERPFYLIHFQPGREISGYIETSSHAPFPSSSQHHGYKCLYPASVPHLQRCEGAM